MRFRLTKLLASVSVIALVMAGCNTYVPRAETPVPAINAGYKIGDIELKDDPVPTLDDVMNRVPSRKSVDEKPEDRLRAPAMRDSALAYGARAGLAYTSRGINASLKGKAEDLTRIYDFNRILIRTASGVTIMPPVISEAKDTYETSDAGRTLRVADVSYLIVEQARFTPTAPLWHTYLVRSYVTPEPPPDQLLPRDGSEREAWKRWVSEGWHMGVTQAQEIFEADLRRLERDFTGMLKYKGLLEEKKVSAPVVAEGNLGNTGTGQDMRVNDRALRITRDPTLQVGPNGERRFEASPLPGATQDAVAPIQRQAVPAGPPRRAAAPSRYERRAVAEPRF